MRWGRGVVRGGGVARGGDGEGEVMMWREEGVVRVKRGGREGEGRK